MIDIGTQGVELFCRVSALVVIDTNICFGGVEKTRMLPDAAPAGRAMKMIRVITAIVTTQMYRCETGMRSSNAGVMITVWANFCQGK
jgi:hypothetical protein